MKSLMHQLIIFKQYHTQNMAKLLQYIGVPALIISLLILLNWIAIDIALIIRISFAWILVLAALVYYYFLNVRVALLTTVIALILTALITLIASPMPYKFSFVLFLVLFIGGLVLLLISRNMEDKKYSFKTGLELLLLAPFVFIIEILGVLKIKKYFGVEDLDSERV